MPSALGTLAVSSAGGCEPAAATASSTTTSPTHASTSLETQQSNNIALQELLSIGAGNRSLDANRASPVNPLSASTTLDGTGDSLAIDPHTQDSPAHDFHVHTKVANDTHAQIKKELEDSNFGGASTMSEAQTAVAPASPPVQEPFIVKEASLEDLEKTGESTTNTHIKRTLATPEKPQTTISQVSAVETSAPLSDNTTSAAASSSESIPKDNAPVLNITLLLPTGARHAFKITESYLTKRGVSIPGTTPDGQKDVYSVSVYQIKELILREWKEEWGAETTVGPPLVEEEGRMRGKPSSPAAIRLIFFGRLLGDGDKIEECRFNKTSPNVVHMTVRPQDVVDEEETERKNRQGKSRVSTRVGDREETTPGCRCLIM